MLEASVEEDLEIEDDDEASNEPVRVLNRITAHALVVYSNSSRSAALRQALRSIGFMHISAAGNHVQGLERSALRNFELVLFEAASLSMPASQFVEGVLKNNKNAILIAVSSSPAIDDVFGLLKAGAQSFLVAPYTPDTIDSVISRAVISGALSDAILQAPDRNGALVGAILNNLYRLAVVMRQGRMFESAKRDIEKYRCHFHESVDLARLFCEGGDEMLREKIMDYCIMRAQDSASRIGRMRRRLTKERQKRTTPAGRPTPNRAIAS